MKNIQGTEESLWLYNQDKILVYEFVKQPTYFFERIYDNKGREISFKHSNGFSWKKIYNENGECKKFYTT